MTPTTADLASLAADQLAEKVRDKIMFEENKVYLDVEAMAALAELQTRANQHAILEIRLADLESAARTTHDALGVYEARATQAEERFTSLVKAAEAFEARATQAEQERDDALAAGMDTAQNLTRAVVRAEAAEARLAETQEALEQIDEMSIGGDGLLAAINVTALAALTTHHTADG